MSSSTHKRALALVVLAALATLAIGCGRSPAMPRTSATMVRVENGRAVPCNCAGDDDDDDDDDDDSDVDASERRSRRIRPHLGVATPRVRAARGLRGRAARRRHAGVHRVPEAHASQAHPRDDVQWSLSVGDVPVGVARAREPPPRAHATGPWPSSAAEPHRGDRVPIVTTPSHPCCGLRATSQRGSCRACQSNCAKLSERRLKRSPWTRKNAEIGDASGAVERLTSCYA